ncbi:hypothetical protein [Streptomyces sp. NPDC058872]
MGFARRNPFLEGLAVDFRGWLDAGEQMSALAVDVRCFLAQQDGGRG